MATLPDLLPDDTPGPLRAAHDGQPRRMREPMAAPSIRMMRIGAGPGGERA
jgi:hypothetical protein